MIKHYQRISINQSDPSLILKKGIWLMLLKAFYFLMFFMFSMALSAQCNSDTPIPFINNTFGNLSATGNVNGICLLCTATNEDRLIDSNLTNFATAYITAGIGASADFRVTDADTDYTAGTYVGYKINTGGLLNLNLLNSITIRTYLNGTLKETNSGTSLLGLGLLNTSGGSYVVGFNTTKTFDAIEISVGSLVG